MYLNRVYFGSGAYGVEAAAQKIFRQERPQVTLAEAAVLAGLDEGAVAAGAKPQSGRGARRAPRW